MEISPNKNNVLTVRAVLFDVGGTLLKPQPSVGGIYADVAKQFGKDIDAETLEKRFRSTWSALREENHFMSENLWRRIVKEVFEPYGLGDHEPLFTALFEKFRFASAWHVYPDVVSTLDQLRKKGLIVGVASNWDERLPELLDQLSLSPYFHHQFISYFMKFQKPDPHFYGHCIATLQLDPAQILHVGDEEENDFLAPQRAGMRSLLIKRKEPSSSATYVNSLLQVLDRLS